MTSSRNSGKKRRHLFGNYYDYTLLFVTLFIVLFGLVMVYSSSAFLGQRGWNDSAHFFKNQLRSAIIGAGAILVVSKINYKLYTKKIFNLTLIHWLYILCLILQTVVLFIGTESHGKSRWISLGPLSFQPSEIGKIAIILLVAYMISKAPSRMNKLSGPIVIFLVNAPMLGLVVAGNLSTAIIMAVIIAAMCFVTSKKYWPYILFVVVAVAIVMIIIMFFSDPYRMERINIWLNVETHKDGYQIIQGLYAIASGGLFGKGIGESMQKLGVVPEAQNDMIFTIICEELGIVGAIAVILMFVLMLYRIFVIAINAPDLYGSLIATGVFTHIAVQVIINIAVVTNSIPSTGIPLPFISYGGTSLIILMAEIGLVLSVSNKIKHERN